MGTRTFHRCRIEYDATGDHATLCLCDGSFAHDDEFLHVVLDLSPVRDFEDIQILGDA